MNKIIKNKDIECVHCKEKLERRMSMVGPGDGALRKGLIMLCANCGGAQILGDTTWRPLTRKDVQRLPPQYVLALRRIDEQLRAKLAAGAKWSPYESQ